MTQTNLVFPTVVLVHAAWANAPALVPDEDALLWMPTKSFADAVARESSADDVLLMAATQKPIAIKCIQEQMTQAAWERSLLGFW